MCQTCSETTLLVFPRGGSIFMTKRATWSTTVIFSIKNKLFSQFLSMFQHKMSHIMRKPTICICENKGADQLISAFVFPTRIVQLDSTISLLSKSKIHLSIFCSCTARFVSDLFGNHIVGFLMTWLICKYKMYMLIYEPPRKKTNNLHMRKQRCRSASR